MGPKARTTKLDSISSDTRNDPNNCKEVISVPEVIKYPRTPHLFDAGGTATTDDDLVLSTKDLNALASVFDGNTEIFVEEKIDGANMAFSYQNGKIRVQNRSRYISSGDHEQFTKLTEWLAMNQQAIIQILTQGEDSDEFNSPRILYGEWVAARHSIPYQRLPGTFIAFDIYDKNSDRFFSRAKFHHAMRDSGIPVVPTISVRTFGPYKTGHQGVSSKVADNIKADLLELLESESVFRADGGTVEGVVLRVDESNVPEWLVHKWKIVRTDFIRGCNEGHWNRRRIEKQVIDYSFAEEYLSNCYIFADRLNENVVSSAESDCKSSDVVPPLSIANGKPQSKRKTKAEARQKREYEAQRARIRRRVPRCVILTGLPGSGKSTFASRLAEGHPEKGLQWMIANQDRMGKKECITLAGQARRGKRIIIDRCNPTEAERSEWLKTMHEPSKEEAALVYFSATSEECIGRVQGRKNHETIPEGKGEKAVSTVAKQLEAPTENEYKKFGVVEIVSSFQESNELLQRWGVDGLSTTK